MPTPTHQFHAIADASLSRRSLSNNGFSVFFFFFGLWFDGRVQMGRSVVGGFGWVDRCSPRSAVHLTLSDRLGVFFLGGCRLSFIGCNELMLVSYSGRCRLILDFSYGGQW